MTSLDNPAAVPGHNQPPSLSALVLDQMNGASFDDIGAVVIGLAEMVIGDPYQEERERLIADAKLWRDGGERDGQSYKPVTEIPADEWEQPATDLGTALADLSREKTGKDDKQREAVKAPFLSATRRIDTVFKARREEALPYVTFLGGLLTKWRLKKEAAAREAERRRLEELRAAQAKADEEARKLQAAGAAATAQEHRQAQAAAEAVDRAVDGVAQAQQQQDDARRTRGHGGTGVAQVRYELVIEDISLVPREYLVVNESLAKQALVAGKKIPGFPGIPGLRLSEIADTSFRAR